MDVIEFLNDITGNNLLLWKVILTTIVFALAGMQVFFAARVHRISGRVAVTLGAVVALSCLAGPAGPTSPTRVLLHSIFGTLVFVILTVKFAVLKLLKSGGDLLPWIGSALFLAFAAIWATSVADYDSAR